MVDAVDALERIEDREKLFSEPQKVMGGASLLSLVGKRLTLLYSMEGHFLYVSNQLRATMNTYGNPNAPSGGNALKFYCSLIGTMKKPTNKSYIYKDPSVEKIEIEENGKNIPNVFGRLVEIRLEKTFNEKTGQTVSIPVKFGHVGGIWQAYEAMQVSMFFGKYTRANSRSSFIIDAEFATELKENNIPFEESVRTETALIEYFDNNPKLTEYILTKYRKLLFS